MIYTGVVYIKITKNSQGQGYYHLVESHRVNGKPKQRTLLSLGKVGEDRLEELLSAISRHKEVFGILDLAKSISVKDTFIFGPLLILEQMFERFGIQELLDEMILKHPKLELDLKQIIFTLVACRFIRPGSKLKVFEYWQKKLYPEMIAGKMELHQIYRALDLLCEHKEEIEKSLYWHGRDLLNQQVDVVLYDLTTLRFESVREDLGKLRRFGYSKEMRTDCTQVILGLLVNPEGIPLGFEVYPGNTFEGKTLRDIVQKMRNKFDVRRFIFVADRGLFSEKNLEEIRSHCGEKAENAGEFIVGMKLGIFPKRHAEFYDRSKFKSICESLEIYETTHEGDRCIITWSKSRYERDQKVREDILQKIRKKLSTKTVDAKSFVSNKNYKKYLKGLSTGEIELDDTVIEEESKKDGFFGIITNAKNFSAQDIVRYYKHLWIIEDAFGEIKGTLKARPIFHWSDNRIVGHLTLCFLSYFCEAQITKILREKNVLLQSQAMDQEIIDPRALTFVEVLKELCEIRAIPVQVRGKTIWVRNDINGNAAKLFLALGLKIPPRLLKFEQNEENVVAQNNSVSVTHCKINT